MFGKRELEVALIFFPARYIKKQYLRATFNLNFLTMKKIFVTMIALSSVFSVYAGGLLTNTNQNIAFLRNPARGASMEIDAAYTNPAGLAFLDGEGFFISVNNQSAFQKRTITADFAPFKGFGGNAVKEFEGETKAWFIPNLQAAYKTGDWAFSVNIGVAGGGGTVDFTTGLPSFESLVAVAPIIMNSQMPTGTPPEMLFGGYSLESQLKGSSITYGAQAGASYAANEYFSVYGGFRFVYVDNGYEGYLKDIKIGRDGTMIPATMLLADPNLERLRGLIGEKKLDCRQTGSGIAPIIGWDFKWEKLNVGVKYEFKTGVELETKVTDHLGLEEIYKDGDKTPYDIPAFLSVGAQYDVMPNLRVSAGYHHFFDSDAKMENGKQEYIDGGINEFLLGVEYRINDLFLVSCGTQITRTGVNDAYQSDMSFSLHSYSVGFGGAIDVTKKLRVNVAYFFTNYSDWTKISKEDYNPMIPVATEGKNTFSRTNQTFGIGVDYKL